MNVPAGHASHVLLPAAVANDPAAHGVHEVSATVGAWCPAGMGHSRSQSTRFPSRSDPHHTRLTVGRLAGLEELREQHSVRGVSVELRLAQDGVQAALRVSVGHIDPVDVSIGIDLSKGEISVANSLRVARR
eukprot:CAMPEP_0196788564 /NCGR_PEP_ID=MMETSP1104-20130614/25160_1 /TAXON_ID=33652 /ORGANISM="Cafeteria sp., Strain Caron Lab Isolate" /LENGTH=131 /DNA_ID=CAMNT_0042158909 /DNA_START=14 /DNA_END=408 /DNA_ORIENTATION=-